MPEPEEEIRGYCMGATWQSKCHKECPLKKLEMKLAEIEKAIKDGKVAFHNIYHNTINTRIKNLCNVLGMKLNDTKSPTIAEMKKFSATLYDIVEGLRQGQVKLKEVLQGFIKHHKKHDSEDWYDDDPHIKELNELLAKLDKKFSKTQLENVRDVEKKRLGENEKIVGAIPSIESNKKKPIASSEIDLPNPNSRIHYLKTLPEFYQPHVERKKTFEIRLNDRDFKVGDYLVLEEWDGKKYTGRENTSEVTYILKADGSFFSFLDDYVIMGIRF